MQESLRSIAEKLAWESTSWTSIEIRSVAEEKLTAQPKITFDSIYIETASGRRLLDERLRRSDGTAGHQTCFFNGESGGAILFERSDIEQQKQAILRRSFGSERPGYPTQRPAALRYHYLIQEPLHRALKRGKELDPSRVLGRDCIPVLFEDAQRIGDGPVQDLIYHLDRSSGIPLKVESTSQGKTLWTWTAISFDKVDDWHLTKSSRLVTNNRDGTTYQKLEEIRFVQYNKEYAESTFDPMIDPNILVSDEIRQKMVAPREPRIQDGGGRIHGGSTTSVGAPIGPRPAAWESWAGPLSLIGGVLLLTVAAMLVIGKLKRT